MTNAPPTGTQTESIPAAGSGGAGDRRRAGELVDEAEELLGSVMGPGELPGPPAVGGFFADGRYARVLALYSQAMRLDPDEPAYPWNFGAALRQLGDSELALTFISRAVEVSRRTGDDEWLGAAANLAVAEAALDANKPEVALLALVRAREYGDLTASDRRQGDRLLEELGPVREELRRRMVAAAELASGPAEGS
jgi:tetratricopeptide (TPR) repeat protein